MDRSAFHESLEVHLDTLPPKCRWRFATDGQRLKLCKDTPYPGLRPGDFLIADIEYIGGTEAGRITD